MRQQAHRPARPPQVACSIRFLFFFAGPQFIQVNVGRNDYVSGNHNSVLLNKDLWMDSPMMDPVMDHSNLGQSITGRSDSSSCNEQLPEDVNRYTSI